MLNEGVQPFHRGFFCDDESIKYPYREDTVPSWVVGVVGILVPAFTVRFSCICMVSFAAVYMLVIDAVH